MVINDHVKYISITLLLFLCGCGLFEEDINGIDDLQPALIIEEENGVEKDIFEYGTNVDFTFKLINNSKNSIEIPIFMDFKCAILNEEEFLLVKQIVEDPDTGNTNIIEIGKPYHFPPACSAIGGPAVIETNSERIILEASWNDVSSNDVLETGNYFVEFTYVGENKAFNIRKEFQIIE